MARIAVLGAGAWGTALAVLWGKTHEVRLWARRQEHAALVQKERANPYLPGFSLPPGVEVTSLLDAACKDAEVIVLAVPASGFQETTILLAANGVRAPVVSGVKGLGSSLFFLHQVAQEELRDCPYLALAGPSFAEEVAQGLPTAVALAGPALLARDLARLLATPHLRIYTSQDVLGVELAGAYKNVLAIASGLSDAMRLGFNARAALVTRGLAELSRLGMALGASPMTFSGLAGIGDTLLSTTSDLSRNRRLGLALGGGQSLHEALSLLGHVAEGVGAAPRLVALAIESGVEVPIISEVNQVLHFGKAPSEAMKNLLGRALKEEGI